MVVNRDRQSFGQNLSPEVQMTSRAITGIVVLMAAINGADPSPDQVVRLMREKLADGTISPKCLQALKDAAPGLKAIALVFNSAVQLAEQAGG